MNTQPLNQKPFFPIIEQKDLYRKKERFFERSITFAFWLLLIYLWQPLISAAAWLFQGSLIYEQMLLNGGYKAFTEILWFYFLAIFFLGGTLILWGKINCLRFRGKSIRKRPPAATTHQVSSFFNIDMQTLSEWQSYKSSLIEFDQNNVKAVTQIS